MRIAIYTSGNGTRMRKALETDAAFAEDVKVLFTEDVLPDSVKLLCEENNIEYIYQPYEKLAMGSREVFSDCLLDVLLKYHIDYVFCNGRHILSGAILRERLSENSTQHQYIK